MAAPGEEAEQAGHEAPQAHPALQHGTSSRMQLVAASGEQAGSGAEEAAAQLEQALRVGARAALWFLPACPASWGHVCLRHARLRPLHSLLCGE